MIKVNKSNVEGELKSPPSKVQAHRIIICSALAGEPVNIPYVGMDNYHSEYVIKQIINASPQGVDVDCGKSFCAFRFLLPIAGVYGKNIRFFMQNFATEEILLPYISCLNSHGLNVVKHSYGYETSGQLSSGDYVLNGQYSSQYVSGLMFALPLLDGDSKIITKAYGVEEYINCTINILKKYGIEIEKMEDGFFVKGGQKYKTPEDDLEIEGDWLSASALFIAAALTGEITVTGLNLRSLQVDRIILDILKQFGAGIKILPNGAVYVKKRMARPIQHDAKYTPDLVPLITVLAAFAPGRSVIKNISHICGEYPNRLKVLVYVLREFNIKVCVKKDNLIIDGGLAHGKEVSGYDDPNIIMAEVLFGLAAGDVVIDDIYAVNKIYPDLVSDLEKAKVSFSTVF